MFIPSQIISPLIVFCFVIFTLCGLKMKEISLEHPPIAPKLYLLIRFWVYQQMYIKVLVHRVRESRRLTDSGNFRLSRGADLLWELLAQQWPQECYRIQFKNDKTPQQSTFIYCFYIFTWAPKCIRVTWKSNRMLQLSSLGQIIWMKTSTHTYF